MPIAQTVSPRPGIEAKRDASGRFSERTVCLGIGPDETRRYAYDSAGRLSRVTDGRGALRESYQYDQHGRRLADINPLRFTGERRYSYSLGNRLGQAGSAQYGHDRAGFRNLKVEAGRETHYGYEPSGLLLGVDLPDGRRIDYTYDASGLRTEKRVTVNGVSRVVEEYIWLAPLCLGGFHDGHEWWQLVYGQQGRMPLGLTKGRERYLILCDQVGTPLALANLDGSIVQYMRYDSFGNLLQVRGDMVRLPLGFAGGLFDPDTGLTRFVWRDYDADTGRFMALDPLREKGGDKDWYGYCVDDPVNRGDAWGLAVQLCKRPPENYFLRLTGQKHYSIKTDSTESGIGTDRIPGQGGDSDAPYSRIQWVDHTGQSSRPDSECTSVPNVDEQCVDRLIQPGTGAGWWMPGLNDCQTNTTEVFNYCRADTE